jgi:hypothetical protein
MEVGDLVQIRQNGDPFEQLAVVVSLDRNTDNSIYSVKVFFNGRMLWVRANRVTKVYPNV